MFKSDLKSVSRIVIIVFILSFFQKGWSDSENKDPIVSQKQETQMNQFLNYSTEYINLQPLYVKMKEERSFPQIPLIKIRLIDVLEEGRCPEDVECARAGWAKILVEVTCNGMTEKRELCLAGSSSNIFRAPEEAKSLGLGNFLSIDHYQVFFVALNPYPSTKTKIEKTQYEAIFFADTQESLDFKKKIVEVAKKELKNHSKDLFEVDRYVAKGILAKDLEASPTYTITLGIPFGRSDQTVWVKVQNVNGEWKATGFSKAGA